ncbi:MAG: bifunctional adenosylcobinamide kinase/adenosylcobinamide-phosphate guanylyltransferase [bacterium]
MNKIVLVTGGCRSGKSRFAQQMAEAAGLRRLYIATSPVLDTEMEERVQRHRQERASRNWVTCEETMDLVKVLEQHTDFDAVLCDCLTLWVNNLMYDAEQNKETFDEDDMAGLTQALLRVARCHKGTLVFVTNEIGCGIVPADALSRRFRDLAGRCNQVMAAVADEVYFVVSGIPLKIKG